jgi:ABC transporter substrate binding protein
VQRRIFLTLVGNAAAWSLAARAQQPAKLPTIGYLGPGTRTIDSQRLAAFVKRLRDLGWIEGRTIAIEYRWAEGRNERLAEIAAEFVRLQMDVIVTGATPPSVAVKQATSVIPIVFRGGGRPGRRRRGGVPCAAGRQRHRPVVAANRRHGQAY